VAGSHARIVATIEHFSRARGRHRLPTLSLNVILAGYNACELPDLVRWAKEVHIDAVGLQPLLDTAYYQPYGDRRREFRPPTPAPPVESPLWASPDCDVHAVLDELIALKRSGYPILNTVHHLELAKAYFRGAKAEVARSRCYVGLNNFLIDPYGIVRLCPVRQPLGSILEELPGALWVSARAGQVRRHVRSCKMDCRLLNCNYQLR
jgi:MoaA/NifB/PqqE/SkfB family radical SAM enzyme